MESRQQLLQEELQRVLESASFARSDRQSKLLRFLVERHIEGRDEELKESVIGVEVFGRKPDYDPKLDSTVRTEAVRLRARLHQYYATEGVQNPLAIELPKGGYVPRCRPRPVSSAPPPTPGKRVWFAAGLTFFLAVTTAAGVRWALATAAPIPIAVLPFANLGESPQDDHFADGLTDEIIRKVADVDGFTVRSRTSSFALKGRQATVREAARELDVEYILEGSVAHSGSQTRVTAQLVSVRDDVPLWAGSFERQLLDALSMQREISRAVVNAVRVKLRRGAGGYDPDAYDLYLRARAADNLRFSGDDEVIGLFEQAIAKDSSIAPAYAGLAVAYAFRSFDSAKDPKRTERLHKMRAAAERAIELDPSLAEAHSALGTAYARLGQWDLAERSFRRAIELDPEASITHHTFARFVLWPLGRMDEALREVKTATMNDPLSRLAQRELADVLLSAGEYDEAAHYCEQLPTEVTSASECVGRARLAQRRFDDAIGILSQTATNNWGYLAHAYAKAGQRDKAEALVASAPARYPNRRGAFQFALVHAGFEDTDKTLEQLRRMAGVGPVRMGFTLKSPEFAFLASDPRVRALRQQVGLPE